jgi:hypothetical protein
MAERKTGRELQAELLERAKRDAAFRQELVSDPRRVLEREFGVTIPETVRISVLEESPENLYLVLPPRPIRHRPRAFRPGARSGRGRR